MLEALPKHDKLRKHVHELEAVCKDCACEINALRADAADVLVKWKDLAHAVLAMSKAT